MWTGSQSGFWVRVISRLIVGANWAGKKFFEERKKGEKVRAVGLASRSDAQRATNVTRKISRDLSGLHDYPSLQFERPQIVHSRTVHSR